MLLQFGAKKVRKIRDDEAAGTTFVSEHGQQPEGLRG
jgi:hypothetical protein